MATLGDKYLKIVNDIKSHISNEEERKYVSENLQDISALYTDVLETIANNVTKKFEKYEDDQNKLEKQIGNLKETVDLIKSDIYEDDGYDFEIVCPYCNHEFVADIESELKEEVECPECHNIIELDWSEDEESGCSGCCSDCEHCEEESENIINKKEQNNNDDDM